MKKVIIAVLVVAFVVAIVVPMVADAQTEQITWGQLKCRYHPRCK